MLVALLCAASTARALSYGQSVDSAGYQPVCSGADVVEGRVYGYLKILPDHTNLIAESLAVYLNFIDWSDEADTASAKCSLYDWNDGSSPSLIDTTDYFKLDTSYSDGRVMFHFVNRPVLTALDTVLICAWVATVGPATINIKTGTNTGDTTVYDTETFGAWPDPLVQTNQGGYRMTIMLYTSDDRADANHKVLHDSVDFGVGQISAYPGEDDIWDDADLSFGRFVRGSATSYNLEPSADGDVSDWSDNQVDSADWQCVNEDNNDADYVNTTTEGHVSAFEVAGIDTSAYGDIDSARILLRGCCTHNTQTADVIVGLDTSGGSFAVDTFELASGSSWGDHYSTPVTCITKAHLAGSVEIDITALDIPNLYAAMVSELELQVFTSASVYTTRLVLGLRNEGDMLDSLGIPSQTGTGWWCTGAYLNIMTTGVTGSPGYLKFRYAINKDTLDDGTEGFAVNTATTDGDSTGATWYWWDGDAATAWEAAGADSVGWDYWPSGIDSVELVANRITRIDIQKFIDPILVAPSYMKQMYNGLIFWYETAEGGSTAANATVGNVQPFASGDSMWIDIYGSDQGAMSGDPDCGDYDRCHSFDDTTEVVLCQISRNYSSSSDGTSGQSSYYIYEQYTSFNLEVVFSLKDTGLVREWFPPDSFTIDSAVLGLYVQMEQPYAGAYLHTRAVLRTEDDRLGHRISRKSTGGFAAYASQITNCYSNRHFRLQDGGAQCELDTIPWDSDGAWTADEDYDSVDWDSVAAPQANGYFWVDVKDIVTRWQNVTADSVLGKGIIVVATTGGVSAYAMRVYNVTYLGLSGREAQLWIYASESGAPPEPSGQIINIQMGASDADSNGVQADYLCQAGDDVSGGGTAAGDWRRRVRQCNDVLPRLWGVQSE